MNKVNIKKIVFAAAITITTLSFTGCNTSLSGFSNDQVEIEKTENSVTERSLVNAVEKVFSDAGLKGIAVSEITIEDISKSAEVQQLVANDIATILSDYSDIYSDVKIEFSGNNIAYKYYYVEGYNLDVSVLETSDWEMICNQIKDSFEKDWRIRPDQVTYGHYDISGNLIFEATH